MRRLVLIRKVILGISEEGMITLRSKEDEALIRYKITQKIPKKPLVIHPFMITTVNILLGSHPYLFNE